MLTAIDFLPNLQKKKKKNWYCILITPSDCSVPEKLQTYETRPWYCTMLSVGLGNW